MANFGVSGNIQGLKALQVKRLKNLAGRRFPADTIVSPEFARSLCEISFNDSAVSSINSISSVERDPIPNRSL